MALSGWPTLSRLLPCRFSTCRAGTQWVRCQSTQSTQSGDDSTSPRDDSSSEPNMLTPMDAENVPDVYVTQHGEVYDKERLARDVSRMYPHTRAKMQHVNQMPAILFEHQQTKSYLRRMYAQYGRASGLDPGIQWPSREEILRMTEAERNLGIPTLQESWVRVHEKKKNLLEKQRKEYEKVDANMAKMGEEIKSFKKRQKQTEETILMEKAKREKLMEEAKELLGFHVDPRDKRFQELVEAKEAAMKKQLKATKKKEKEAKVIARLTVTESTESPPS